MRRGVLAALALLSASSVASAQVQVVPAPRGVATPATTLTPDDVVRRLMTFDQNSDGRVTLGELSERMRPLVSRGDKNGDSALDWSEIRTMAAATATPVTQQNHRVFRSGGYGFGDDVGLSSMSHIEGALEDLRLASDAKERALPIVKAYADTVGQTATAELISRMEPLLSPEQMAAFTVALGRQTGRQITLKGPTGEVRRLVAVRGGVAGDLTTRVEAMQLGPAKTEQAKKAIDDFKARTRLATEPERSGLLAQLQGILTAEELDNYRAALERRPVVASDSQLAALVNGFVRNGDIIDVVKPAVLVDKLFAVGGTFR